MYRDAEIAEAGRGCSLRNAGLLSALNSLSTNVDTQMQEQLGRRAELAALKSLCDGLSIQVTDARHQIDGITATQHKLLPLTTQITELKHQVDKTESAF